MRGAIAAASVTPSPLHAGLFANADKEASMPKSARNILKKSVDVEVAPNGTIRGYAATWTREPDSWGDVVARGAFAKSIERHAEEGRALPLLWNHEAGDLKSFIGTVTELAEDDHGLLFSAAFDGTERAQRARELALDGRLCKFSFAYDVLDQMEVELGDGRKANELRELDIHEVSLVMYPANPDTSVVEVKGAPAPGAKAGRRNSKADEAELRSLLAKLGECMDAVSALIGDEEAPDDQDDADDEGAGSSEGGEGEATPKGREDEKAFVEAYKEALLCAYGRREDLEAR